MNRRVTSVSLALCLAAIALPAAASADTVKIGSTLGHPRRRTESSAQTAWESSGRLRRTLALPLVSPANGVVTQWAVRTSDAGAVYNLRILRPINNSSYTGVGTSPERWSFPL